MMSSEISTYLTGRYVTFRIFTLSFEEYLTFKKQYGEIDDNHKELVKYIKYGGFPPIHLREYPLDNAYTIVRDIYNSTIFFDIVRRNQIRKVDQLERVVKFVFDNVGKTFSAKSISDYTKYLLTTDDFAGGNYQGIKTMHVAGFLLSNEY